MNSPDQQYLQRFEILRRIALDGAAAGDLANSVRDALAASAELLGLTAARVILWDDDRKVILNVTHAPGEREGAALDELEEDIFADLRRNRQLRSAFLAFDGDPPLGVFTVPLYRGPRILGAALGVRVGEGQLIKEDHFLESLAAAISLAVIAQIGAGGAASVDQRRIDDERLKAALEVAVTVNHEINNPLTAALGNVQLILMQKDKLDPDLRRKLEVVEKSALQIRDVTQRLLSLTEARSTTYAGDETMIDLNTDSAADDDSASDTSPDDVKE